MSGVGVRIGVSWVPNYRLHNGHELDILNQDPIKQVESIIHIYFNKINLI